MWAASSPAGDRGTNGAIVGGIVILAAPDGAEAIPVLWRAALEPLPLLAPPRVTVVAVVFAWHSFSVEKLARFRNIPNIDS